MGDKTGQRNPRTLIPKTWLIELDATMASQPPSIPQKNRRKHSSRMLGEHEKAESSLSINGDEEHKAKRGKAGKARSSGVVEEQCPATEVGYRGDVCMHGMSSWMAVSNHYEACLTEAESSATPC